MRFGSCKNLRLFDGRMVVLVGKQKWHGRWVLGFFVIFDVLRRYPDVEILLLSPLERIVVILGFLMIRSIVVKVASLNLIEFLWIRLSTELSPVHLFIVTAFVLLLQTQVLFGLDVLVFVGHETAVGFRLLVTHD